MFERDNGTAGSLEDLHRSMRERGAYRGLRLALWVLERALTEGTDESGAVTAGSAVAIRRALASRDEEECSAIDVQVAVRQLISQGVLEPESTTKRFVLVGFAKTGGQR